LLEALDSLTQQTFTDCDILVFDDGSQDDTRYVIEKAAEKDRRIRLVGSQRIGLVSALNQTIAASESDLIARMDGDDISHPKRLAEQVELLDSAPELALVSCLIKAFPQGRVQGGMDRYVAWLNSLVEPDELARDMFVESPLCHPSVVMRRRSFDMVGGYVDDGKPEDYGLWLRFYEKHLKMAKVKQVRFFWRESKKRLTRTDRRYGSERFFQLKLRHLLKGPLRGRREVVILGAGRTGKMWSRALAKEGMEVTAFVDVDPTKRGKTVHGAPVMGPEDLASNVPPGFLLAAVGTPHARGHIRNFLGGLRLGEPGDFICLA
jgi:glycosyltransferase involved in cell wall biosynthesis